MTFYRIHHYIMQLSIYLEIQIFMLGVLPPLPFGFSYTQIGFKVIIGFLQAGLLEIVAEETWNVDFSYLPMHSVCCGHMSYIALSWKTLVYIHGLIRLE